MHKIMIVDDDPSIINVMRKILEASKYIVFDAYDVPSAREVIEKEKPDCIVSDLSLPKLTGLDLLAWSKEKNPVPFILVTGFSHLIETKKAYALGVRHFITKPFEREELLLALEKCLKSPEKENENKPNAVEYSGISIDEFVCGSAIPYKIFLKLSSTKYVAIANTGEDVTRQRITVFRSKGVTQLYLRREDFSRYLGFTTHLFGLAAGNSKISKAKKVHLLKHIGELIVQNSYVRGVDEGSFALARDYVESVTGLLMDSDDGFLLLESLKNSSDFLFRHSVAVSLYSVLIARNMGVRTAQIVARLATGGMFHDIGKKEMDRALLEKPKLALSVDEQKLFEHHPVRGVEILSEIRSVSSDVLQIVLQHHEDCLGYGFPQRLKKHRLHPLGRIVAAANLFVETALDVPPSLSGEEAVTKILETSKWKLDPDVLAGLTKTFSMNEKKPPKTSK